jgi:hypothetical protein
MPALTAWGAGRGELSTAIKQIALILGMEGTLNIAGALVGSEFSHPASSRRGFS